MGNRRVLLLVLGLIILIVFALGGFYLYLTGGQAGTDDASNPGDTGLIPVRTLYTYGDDKPLAHPVGAGVDGDGNFYISLRDSATIVKFDSDGDYISHWGEHGTQPGQMLSPLGVSADSLSGHVYVTDRARLRLIAYDLDGTFLWETPLLSPLASAVTPDGEIVVATFGPLVKMSAQGEFEIQVGTRGLEPGQFDFPRSIVVGEDGDVYVADSNNTRIQRVTVSGELTATTAWVTGVPPRFQDDPETLFTVPSGIALDEQGRVIVLDGFRHIIYVLDPDTGEIIHDFGERRGPNNGAFNMPTSIAHINSDYFVITDTFNDRVQIVRLLTPDENTLVARYPWLLWLLPLLLLPLLFFFGKKRYFLTEEVLDKAVGEGNARLILAAFPHSFVLKEVYERFEGVTEDTVRLGDYLEPMDAAPVDEAQGEMASEESLARIAERSRAQRVLLARHRVLCVDDDQRARFDDLGAHTMTYDEALEEYVLGEE